MVNYPTILKLPQEDINRQFYEMILKLQKEVNEMKQQSPATIVDSGSGKIS